MNKEQEIRKLHKKGYNCAQAFLCVWSDELNIDKQKLFKLSEGLGRGVGGLEDMCCIPIISSMIVSFLETSDSNLENPQTKLESYACAKCLAMEFKDEYRSLKCSDILKTNCKERCCTDVLVGGYKMLRRCLDE
ncbi:MAG: C-GCAxxG-C-C family protein [Thomasclavelia sp.]|jgi:C_GCAxxG_C_C family probable redox protein|nr:C-GCAxxG-C-C family protein [Thomasclavelia sp.]